jgi:signal transduction histidine kinase
MLYAAQVQLRMTEGALGKTPSDGEGDAAERLTQLNEMIDRAIQVTRNLTVDLSPPVLEKEGLREALPWLATQMNELYGLTVHIEVVRLGDDRLLSVQSEEMRVLLFQLVRELLFNVVKHAGVDEARVRLAEQNDELRIYVEDEGVGFDVDAAREAESDEAGFGLYSVAERLGLFGGSLAIESTPGQGTQAIITVPVR